jgi:hypothetical protein
MTSLAADLDVDVRTAVSVSRVHGWTLRVGAIAVTPLHEAHHGGQKVDALGGDDVLLPASRSGLLVGLGGKDPVPYEHLEPLGEQVAGAAENVLEVSEAR